MITNISEVFNSVLEGAHSLPVIALVQLTFFRLNSYFVARREVGANRLTSTKQFTPLVDAQIQGRVVKVGSMEIVLYDHVKGLFHVKSRSSQTHRLNLHEKICTCGKTLIYGFPCNHIITACQHHCVDFRLFVEGYYTTKSYYDTWAALFHPIFNEDEWPLYDGTMIVPPGSMQRIGSGHPKSTRLHNEMDVREGKTPITCGLCKQLDYNRRSCKNRNQVHLMNVYEYMNVAGPIIYDLVLLAGFTTRIQLKAEGEVCFFLVLMRPDPHSSFFLDLSVKWYDNDDVKGVNFLQGKFHSFHLVATIVSYLTKAPTSPHCRKRSVLVFLSFFLFLFYFLFVFCVCVVRGCDMWLFCVFQVLVV